MIPFILAAVGGYLIGDSKELDSKIPKFADGGIFEENHPERLKEFLYKLNLLIDEYHANIYLIDGVFEGVDKIEDAVNDELAKSGGMMAKGGMTKSEIADEVESMKRMLESCYTYGGIEKGSYYYEKYILPYKETLGKELFDKVYKEESKRLKNYEVVKDVHIDAEGVSYNQLKQKK